MLFILMATSFAVLIPATVNAASPVSYVTITLTNSQTTPTPKDFQQLIKVDWSTYASNLNANVSNVRFYNSTTFASSYELSGWIETNNTTSATSSNVWVNLSGTIVPASGTATIYMAFLPTTSSWSSHWGLAPQLDKTYGKHDNGASVFAKYWNFLGTATPAGWTLYGATVNNGIQVPAGDSGAFYAQYSISAIPNYIVEAYGDTVATASANKDANGFVFGLGTSGSWASGHNWYGVGTNSVLSSSYYVADYEVYGSQGVILGTSSTSIGAHTLAGGYYTSTGATFTLTTIL